MSDETKPPPVTFRPRGDWVLLRPCKHRPPKTESGVEGDPNAKDPFPVSRVLAVGSRVTEVRAGELVMVAEVKGSFVANEEFLAWTTEDAIHGSVEGEDPANLDEGVTEEQVKERQAEIARARELAEIKRQLQVGATTPHRGHALVNGRRVH